MKLHHSSVSYFSKYAIYSDTNAVKVASKLSRGPDQLQFLIGRGLKPTSTLLDFGCGVGRLTRYAVPYLDPGCYTGMDISTNVLIEARKRVNDNRDPQFIQGKGDLKFVKCRHFDMIWACSVLPHMPPDAIEVLFENLSNWPIISFGVFYFTYSESDELKQTAWNNFNYTSKWFIRHANRMDMNAELLDLKWLKGHCIMKVWKP